MNYFDNISTRAITIQLFLCMTDKEYENVLFLSRHGSDKSLKWYLEMMMNKYANKVYSMKLSDEEIQRIWLAIINNPDVKPFLKYDLIMN